ncbi:thiamine phosphate synthase [Bremerella alba]|uniref:Thiamine-phosphate synthase n=1 Tax=Bremerella alba TaxID=980252 RepID=A0A7V8V7A4_9BACT|nr:thiamine phosphate synthase [Bremerella alba]MBA2116277.1 Thiamine-phosphate synthase [Bremerella alba]
MTDPDNLNDGGLPPTMDISLWRTLDASANRASEGLRVIEDYVRYGQNDVFLTTELKTLRHQLDSTLQKFERAPAIQSRDTFGDVGTSVQGKLEQTRSGWADLLTANFKRLQQALRSLEEHAKLVDGEVAASFERGRYLSYSLEKMVMTTVAASQLFPQVSIYVLIDGGDDGHSFDTFVATLVDAEVDVIQLRDKKLDDRTLLARAQSLRKRTAGTSTKMILNDRADLAKVSGADGVHVGQEELTVSQVRSVLGAGKLVGVSTHSIDQARQAVRDGADYIGIGPTFPSGTKNFEAFPGVELLREVAGEITLPGFAIGGIDPSNIAEVAAVGIRRVAVAGSVTTAVDPGAVVQAMRTCLSTGSENS